jgi:hypothetical protein
VADSLRRKVDGMSFDGDEIRGQIFPAGIWIPSEIYSANILSCEEKLLWGIIKTFHCCLHNNIITPNKFITDIMNINNKELENCLNSLKIYGLVLETPFTDKTKGLLAIHSGMDLRDGPARAQAAR